MHIKSLLLILAAAPTSQSATAQSNIYKCIVQGKTIYSESPCGIGTNKQTKLEIDNSRMGNVTYDKDTIDSTRARIRHGMNQPGASGVATGTATPKGDKKYVCESVRIDLENLDAAARQPNSGYAQDSIKQRKLDIQKTAYEWKC